MYKKKNYKIYSAGNEFIIHNSNKPFNDGHSHVKNFKTCVYLINLSIHKSIPHHLNTYFLVSLLRISDDKEYQRKIQELLYAKQDKSDIKYYNKPKHFKKK